ncbi:uncharacterized protein LOC124946456 [Vespa velutina]|uniref:uncharacterized protein LOC124946456 n=1 Tax=Vespa velutina TaxID=202808 RepID=UPI001FB1E340|nr:uncharacterized protein LOC124946456 [Vespa velutina]XP_047343131.1 uncharacterized protein LOC124946456 [Vespa velutina]
MNKSHMDKRLNQLPTWLWANSATLPPIYKIVWEAVREDRIKSNGLQTEVLVDTNKVFPLLLTSQLSMEVLGHIWNLANQKYAGQLTEQELYIVLALVAAAQASYTFNSLDILHLLPFPPIPYLNIECVLNVQSTMYVNASSKYQANKKEESNNKSMNFEEKYTSEFKGKINKTGQLTFDSNLPVSNVVDKTSYLDNETCSTLMINSNSSNSCPRDYSKYTKIRSEMKSNICTLDNNDDFSEFQSAPIVNNTPSMSNWDMRQGSAIGSRLANHNLGVKKPVEKPKRNNTNSKTMNFHMQTHASLSSLNPVSQNLSLERLSELFPKCAIKNQSKTVILKDTIIRNNDLSKDNGETIRDLKTNILENIQLSGNKSIMCKLESTDKAGIKEVKSDQRDLMNLQSTEDKYSALRALVNETSVTNKTNSVDNITSNDEFGEFVSAEQTITDANSILDNSNHEYFRDTITGFETKSFNNTDDNNTAGIDIIQDISQSLNNVKFGDNVEEQRINEKFEPKIEPGKLIQMEDAISLNSIELMNGISDRTITRSGSVPSLDLKSFLPTNSEEDQIIQITQQTVYWEWKQYMESCISLLQIAANIFTNITSEVILNEVLNSAQGYNFLCNLAEVAAVCRRVNFSYKEMDINIIGFDDLLMDIDRIWAEMEPFYANIPIVTELPTWPLHQGECISCALCLTVITSDKVIYNENNYHVTCANLWLNCVNNQLPAIQYPTFYSFTNICSTNNHI